MMLYDVYKIYNVITTRPVITMTKKKINVIIKENFSNQSPFYRLAINIILCFSHVIKRNRYCALVMSAVLSNNTSRGQLPQSYIVV